MFWPEKITNENLWEITNEEKVEITIKRHKWKDTLRKLQDNQTSIGI